MGAITKAIFSIIKSEGAYSFCVNGQREVSGARA